MNRFNTQTRRLAQAAAAGALVLASQAQAQGQTAGATGAINVADVVASIEAQAVPVALIGSAVLILFVGIKAYKWVRRALS